MPTRVAIYARSERDDLVERQLEAAREFASARGWNVVAEHVESDRHTRPVRDALLRELDDVDAVLVWEVATIARVDADAVQRKLQDGGARLLVVGPAQGT